MREVPLYVDCERNSGDERMRQGGATPVGRSADQIGTRSLMGYTVLGYLAHKKAPPPQDQHRALGIDLLEGPRGERFLMSDSQGYPSNTLSPSHARALEGVTKSQFPRKAVVFNGGDRLRRRF